MAVPARAHEYDELKLRFERGDGGECRVIASAPGGEAAGRFELPFSELELENFVLRLGRASQGRRRMESSEMSEARRFGGQLFEALFQDRVRDLYHGALARAEGRGRGLRITLHLTDAPELLHLPWEYLCDEPKFLAISAWTPVVRYLDLPRQRGALELQPPLRILAMVSSPADAVALDVAQERANLEGALGNLIAAGAIELCWLEQATLRALLRELREGEFHIFHYIGHGLYDPQSEDGVLLLEAEDGRGRAVSGRELGTILHDCTSLRLAVLNTCEGARSARNDPFAGVAASLLQCEIPAVIAMQFEITDAAAIVFSEGFYEALAVGFPVDAALAEARKAIYADHNDTEWGTPVLFMRVPDGRIFDIPEPPRLSEPKRVVADTSTTIAAIEESRVESPQRVAHQSTVPTEPLAMSSSASPPPDHTSRSATPARPRDPRSVLRLIADIGTSASAILLLAALFLPWRLQLENAPNGWNVGLHVQLMAVLAVAVLVLVWARRTGRLRNSSAPTAALTFVSLLVDDLLVLRGTGGTDAIGPGRELAIYALIGIVFSGWLTLAAEATASSNSRRGELISVIGALGIFSALFLEYATETGWDYFVHQETMLGTLLGLVVLIALARLTLTSLGASQATAALLVLIGAVLAQRLALPHILHRTSRHPPDTGAIGYWAALGSAFIIILGGLIAVLSDWQQTSRRGKASLKSFT